jgi:arginine decarboxylase
MLGRTNIQLKMRVMVVDDRIDRPDTARGRAVVALVDELERQNVGVEAARSYDDAEAIVVSDAGLHCYFVDWTLGANDNDSHGEATRLLRTIRSRNARAPVFLMADRDAKRTMTVEAMGLADEFVWMLEDTSAFVAGRALAAMRRYLGQLLPPFTDTLLRYSRSDEHSWSAPGHQGGIAFTKSPVGRVFFDFFGENLFRTDSGIERGNLGSLLDHSGPVAASEAFIARVFGADRTYSVLSGTSGSNRTIFMACVGENEFALCDRNCHKSIEQGLILTGGLPVYMTPTRNRYGIIGPLSRDNFTPETIRARIAAHPLRAQAVSDKPVYAVVTNSTYDGMLLNVEAVEAELGRSVDRIHFDEAWYGYARFNPLYSGRYAMRGEPNGGGDGPTVFATHSTHKLLAALSQASYIHLRNGRNPVDHSRFNESFVIQSTTSPLYSLYASNEVAAAMMDGDAGRMLTQEVIDEAVDFRQALARVHRTFADRGEWFFAPWNAPEIRDAKTGRMVPFADADREQLRTDPSCWVLEPGATWHGFAGLEEGWAMLDPIKAGIVTPGMGDDGELLAGGIPAPVLSAYLGRNATVPSRTTDFMVLCLFTIGITKGKWGTLINTLLAFKRDHDANVSLAQALPDLVAAGAGRYDGMGLRDLAEDVQAGMREMRMDAAQAAAFGNLPEIVTTPRAAFQRLQAGKAELVPLEAAAGRITACGIMPYPPGIPIVMPGERMGALDGPWLSYIRALEAWGERYPGFEKEVEGAVHKDGKYHFWCLAE